MPKNMGGAAASASDARSTHSLRHKNRDSTMGSKGAKRSARADKQDIGVSLGSSVLQVVYYGISNLLGQRQPGLAPSFTSYVYPGFFPIDIVQTNLDNVSGP
jgi:hypothetical protein